MPEEHTASFAPRIRPGIGPRTNSHDGLCNITSSQMEKTRRRSHNSSRNDWKKTATRAPHLKSATPSFKRHDKASSRALRARCAGPSFQLKQIDPQLSPPKKRQFWGIRYFHFFSKIPKCRIDHDENHAVIGHPTSKKQPFLLHFELYSHKGHPWQRSKANNFFFTLLDLCVSSLRRGHANLLCIVTSYY